MGCARVLSLSELKLLKIQLCRLYEKDVRRHLNSINFRLTPKLCIDGIELLEADSPRLSYFPHPLVYG